MTKQTQQQQELDLIFAKIVQLKAELALAEQEYDTILYKPEYNVFDTIEHAEDAIEDMLRDLAHSECEGSYNRGQDQYTQLFYVGDVLYEGTLDVEYNRHDKTYYYVDRVHFTYKEVEK